MCLYSKQRAKLVFFQLTDKFFNKKLVFLNKLPITVTYFLYSSDRSQHPKKQHVLKSATDEILT